LESEGAEAPEGYFSFFQETRLSRSIKENNGAARSIWVRGINMSSYKSINDIRVASAMGNKSQHASIARIGQAGLLAINSTGSFIYEGVHS
jgi:hypothetical protein